MQHRLRNEPKVKLDKEAKRLSKGHSGVQVSTVERLLEFYNKNIIPFVYELGSASKIEALKTDYRKVVSKMEEDRVIHVDLMKTVEFLRTIDVDEFEGFSA